MVNPFKEVNWRPGVVERRTFARSLVVGFPCVAIVLIAVLRWRSGTWDFETPLWIGGIGAGLGVLFFLIPSISRPFYLLWFAVACSIGLVVSNLLLAVVYYLVVTAIGLIKRATGYRAIRKKVDKSAPSYWVDVEKPPNAERYFRQF